MSKHYVLISLVLILSALFSACSSPASTAPAEEPASDMMEEPADTMMSEETSAQEATMEEPAGDMMDETPAQETMDVMPATQEVMETPSWYGVELVNASTGEKFSIHDFEGKVVLVETMAIWCPTCLAQQVQIEALHEKLGMREDFASVTLDVDPNENQADLQSYQEQNGFDWTYAVAPAEVAREIGQLYGDQFLHPPSAPVLIIDRHGAAHPLPFGLKSADDLFEAVNQYLGEM